MPTLIQRSATATKQMSGYVLGGGTVAGIGAGLQATAASIAAMVGGTTATAAAITTVATVAAPVVLTGGALVAGGAIVFGLYKVFRPRDREKYNGEKVTLKDLSYKYWSCNIYRVGVVGFKRAGKTEIKTRLRGKGSGDRNTDHIATHILHADQVRKVFVALIDGRGADEGERDQQFKIADESDILVVVVDHRDTKDDLQKTGPAPVPTGSPQRGMIDQERLGNHETFVSQLREHLGRRKDKKDLRVIFAVNKKDEWENVQPSRDEVQEWAVLQRAEWAKAAITVGEDAIEMSALNSDDIENLKRKIVEQALLIEENRRHG